MAAQRQATNGTQTPRSAVRRRGLMAGAAALVVGLVAKSATDAAPVAATSGGGDQGFLALGSNPWYIAGFTTPNTAAVSASPTVLQASVNFGNFLGENGGDFVVLEVDANTANSGNITGITGFGRGLGAGLIGSSPTGTGVYALSSSGGAVYGAADTGTAVYGRSSLGVGVFGQNTNGGSAPFGVVGTVKTAPGFALYGIATVAGTVGFAAGANVAGAIAGQFSGPVNVYGGPVTLSGAGNSIVAVNGATKNAAMQLPDGSYGLLHCVEAPEPWFEDFGKGQLVGGKAEVKLEANFAATVDTTTLHVFVTPHDETHHLAVKATTGTGFSIAAEVVGQAAIRGVKGTDLNGTFTYRVVAKRKDVKGDRFARFVPPKEIKLAPPPVPPVPPKPKTNA